MNPNKLRHIGNIWKPSDNVGTKGDQKTTYTDDGQIACFIEPLGARELFFARQLRGDVTHKITIMFTARVTHRHRIVWNGRTFDLGPPLSPEEDKVEMIFTAVEVK